MPADMSPLAADRVRQRRRARPAFFNLLQIQLPVGALTSIAHRVAGVGLAVATPFAAYLLGVSLRGPDGYAAASALLDRWWLRLAAVVAAWALVHHLLAGLRHLLMDVDVGSALAPARRSAWAVNVAGVALGLLAAAAWL